MLGKWGVRVELCKNVPLAVIAPSYIFVPKRDYVIESSNELFMSLCQPLNAPGSIVPRYLRTRLVAGPKGLGPTQLLTMRLDPGPR